MRYEVRRNNGAWKVIDLLRYEDIACFDQQGRADEYCAASNASELLKQVKASALAVPNPGYIAGDPRFGDGKGEA
jgi:hypothetical protein